MVVVVLGGHALLIVSAHIWRRGMSVCMGAQRKERGNRKSEKWNKMEEEGDRGRAERRALKEKCTACSPCHHFYTHYYIFSVSIRFSEKPRTEDVHYSALVTYKMFRQWRTMTAHTCHTPYSP